MEKESYSDHNDEDDMFAEPFKNDYPRVKENNVVLGTVFEYRNKKYIKVITDDEMMVDKFLYDETSVEPGDKVFPKVFQNSLGETYIKIYVNKNIRGLFK